MIYAAKALSMTMADLYKNPSLISAVKEDYLKNKNMISTILEFYPDPFIRIVLCTNTYYLFSFLLQKSIAFLKLFYP